MKPMHRIAFIGNHLPRHCGIATFTHDLHHAVAIDRPDLETGVVAMTDDGHQYDYPPCTIFEIRENSIDDYVRAAAFLEATGTDMVSLQHEYGIFGGDTGRHIVELLSRLTMPVVTTLHTGTGASNTCATRRDGPDHRALIQSRRDGAKGARPFARRP